MELRKTTPPSGANRKNFCCGGNFPQVIVGEQVAQASLAEQKICRLARRENPSKQSRRPIPSFARGAEKWRWPRSLVFVHAYERSPTTTRPEPTAGAARKFTGVVCWIISVCVGLRKSQVKTLAELVAAALRMPRASLAELGRRLAASTCKTAKHCIKRAWRFTSNERIHIPEAMQGPLSWLFHQRPYWKKHPLVVSMDQTKVRSFPTLMLATVVRGRALPLLWESYEEGKLPKSQNYLEERLLRVLRSLVPSWVRVIVVADRGFGRTELASSARDSALHSAKAKSSSAGTPAGVVGVSGAVGSAARWRALGKDH
jgi:hypothetical protein